MLDREAETHEGSGMKPRIPLFVLGVFSLGAALTLYMGWLGSAEIAHRQFDLGGFLIAGSVLVWRAFSGQRKATQKPSDRQTR
ncbi:hypothetical protein VVT58_04025 [Sphingobium sp. SJ10-10]|uniref:hypothetical protein n=1 Tax=Sphingobium sp. SJ10-10 TaxID=3114999 RepID=UPI002E18B836|nr:hypothetical protein [Sphingobium sp. SJ10-10]